MAQLPPQKKIFLWLAAGLGLFVLLIFALKFAPTKQLLTQVATETIPPYGENVTGCCYVSVKAADDKYTGYYADSKQGQPMTPKLCQEYAKEREHNGTVETTYFVAGMKCPSEAAGSCPSSPGKRADCEILEKTATGESMANAQANCMQELQLILKCPGGCERYLCGPPSITSLIKTRERREKTEETEEQKEEWTAKCKVAASCRYPGKVGQ